MNKRNCQKSQCHMVEYIYRLPKYQVLLECGTRVILKGSQRSICILIQSPPRRILLQEPVSLSFSCILFLSVSSHRLLLPADS